MRHEIEYQRVDDGKYHHQVTVTYYPALLFRLFGAKPWQEVFVADWLAPDGRAIWYELPSFESLSMFDPLDDEIGCHIRQTLFASAV